MGASSGIGLELVKLWLLAEYQVVASARNASNTKALLELQKTKQEQLQLIDIDVSSIDSVKEAVPKAWEAFNGLDVWFYNAAIYEVMPINAWKVEHFEAMTQVNYLGAVRVMTQLIPYFKEQKDETAKSRRWIWNASLSSYFGLPLGGAYSAPKAALVNLAEALQPELKANNIELQIINHGFVKTRLTQKNDFEMPELMSAQEAAQKILKATEKPYRFEIHFPFKLATFLQLLKILPYRLSLYLSRKAL